MAVGSLNEHCVHPLADGLDGVGRAALPLPLVFLERGGMCVPNTHVVVLAPTVTRTRSSQSPTARYFESVNTVLIGGPSVVGHTLHTASSLS